MSVCPRYTHRGNVSSFGKTMQLFLLQENIGRLHIYIKYSVQLINIDRETTSDTA